MKFPLFLWILLVSPVSVTGNVYKLTARDYVDCDVNLMIESCYDSCASYHCSDHKVKENIVRWMMDSRSRSSPAFKQVYWDCPVLLTTKDYGNECRGKHAWDPGWIDDALAKAKVDAKVEAVDSAKSPWRKKAADFLPTW